MLKRMKTGGYPGALAALLFLVALIAPAPPAMAHKVMVFAWVEGDTVHTESKFSGGKRVNHGKISVTDGKGKLLLTGETDDGGNFSFRAPSREMLTIVMDSGMGHRAEWTVPAHEFEGGSGQGAPSPAGKGSPEPAPSGKRTEGGAAMGDADLRAVEAAVERALDRKLSPLKKMLAEESGAGPKASEIFSGIGYILGLAGVGIYFGSRRERRDRDL